MQGEDFQQAYQKARRQVVSQAIAQVQAGMAEAVQTLRDVMNNTEAAAFAWVSAARAMIGFGVEMVEIEDLEKRITALENRVGNN